MILDGVRNADRPPLNGVHHAGSSGPAEITNGQQLIRFPSMHTAGTAEALRPLQAGAEAARRGRRTRRTMR